MLALYLPENNVIMIDSGRVHFSNIIRIGNSKGLIIPSSILKSLSLKEKDEVELTVDDNALCIKKIQPFTGPFTGMFSDMPKPGPGSWGGDMSAADYVDEMRAAGGSREIPEW